MQLRSMLLVALATAAASSSAAVKLAEGTLPAGAQPGVQPADSAGVGKIEHKPLERSRRGVTVFIRAQVKEPSRLFAPLVFARAAGSQRYGAYSMLDQGRRGFLARLPASILDEGSFEYFIEARHDEGEPTRYGSPTQPFVCVAYDPPPRPVKATFRTDEPGATLMVDDNEVGKTPITVALGPGPHVLQVIAPDGRSTEQQLDVKTGRKLDMLIPLPSRAGGPASLGVTSEPSGAHILIDGKVAGTTPYATELAPGAHTVTVELEGRLRQERQIVARQGRDVQLAFVLPAMPKEPALTVESDPPGALVILDGKERGRTPFLAPVPPGKHELVLSLPGRRDVGTEFAMPRDKDLSLRRELPIAAGAAPRLTVASVPEGASVLIGGKEVGLTPWSGELRLGDHKVQVRRAGYLTAERAVTIHASRDADLSFALERAPGPGRLSVETDPPDAEISIDGQPAVNAPYSGELASGDHSVEVSSAGYRTVGQQITLLPGQQASLRIALSSATQDNAAPIVGVNSAPEGALLYVDGKLIGPTPRKAPTTPGQHELRLVLDGYKTWSAPTRLPDKPGFELRVAVALKPVREAESHDAPAALELARAQYKRADACYAAGDFACAAAGYQAAYDLARRPELLFNVAQAQRRQGNLKEALAAYQAFLRETRNPNPKVRTQADQYIAFCQFALQPAEPGRPPTLLAGMPETAAPAGGGAVAVSLPGQAALAPTGTPSLPEISEGTPQLAVALPPEDVQPPVLKHEPIRNARAGSPLTLSARIVDEGSAVGDAQACWRNLFQIEFECAPLKPAGHDEYEAVVPASALADGFAYYLEASDSAGNGPVRSGTPEAPHSVAIAEARSPVGVAVGEAIKGSGTVQSGAEQASFVQPSTPMGAKVLPAAGDLQRDAGRPWKFRALIGAERSTESYTEGVTRGYAALQATRALPQGFVALAQFDWRSASQPYVLPSPSEPRGRTSFDEQRYDVIGAAGYDLGALLLPGRFSLQPMVGLHYLALRNELSPADYLGAVLIARGSFRVLPLLEVRADIGYTFRLSSSTTRSELGRPLRELALRGGLALPFGGRYALEANYQADFLAFTYVTRAAHGAALGFDTSF